jgi:tetrahydromethanopterin S-methyltransferase subunit A
MIIMLKVDPAPEYPPEDGRYLRGNDKSPVAVIVILNTDEDKIPTELEELVRIGIETGAALSGTLQTENIGIEKVVCNIVSNPNIRYIILTGPESLGHLTGEALLLLHQNGLDEKKKIIGSNSPTPYLYNLPDEFIIRFREQIVTMIDLLNKGTPEKVKQAVWSCYQEQPTDFLGYELYDMGAFAVPPLSGKITMRVTEPWYEPKDEAEADEKRRLEEFMAMIKNKVEEKKRRESEGK